MRRTYNVGSGLGKKSLTDALNLSKSGDTILISPGEYNVYSDTINVDNSVVIRGIGKSPKDVVIRGLIDISNCENVEIENLSLENLNGSAIGCVNCSLSMKNIFIKGDISGKYHTLYMESSRLNMLKCEIVPSDSTSLGVKMNSTLAVSESILPNLYVEKSSLTISNCQVNGCIQLNEAHLSSTDYVEFLSENGILDATNGSSAKFEYMNFPVDDPVIALSDSELIIKLIDEESSTLFVGLQNNNIYDVPLDRCVVQNIDDDLINDTEQEEVMQSRSSEYSYEENDYSNYEEYEEDDYSSYDEEYEEYEENDFDNYDEEDDYSVYDDESQISGRDQLEELVGLHEVKKEIDAFIKTVSFNEQRKKQGLKQTNFSFHSLFLGNPGTGKTTVARILQDLLYEEGVIRNHKFIEVDRSNLVSDVIGGTEKLTKSVLDSARGGILFIDEAYSLYSESANDFGKEAVDTILKYMEDNRDDIIVIFAGYTDKMQNFINMNPGLKSRVTNIFHFEDYTPSEISEIGYRYLLSQQYTVDEERYKSIIENKYRYSVDKSNARWVRNANEELIKILIDRVISSDEYLDMSYITDEDLNTFIGGTTESKEEKINTLINELNSLIGLSNVKKLVLDTIKQAQAEQKLLKLDAHMTKPAYNMVFTGNPGTGKTTVAKIVADIFYNLGILSSNVVNVVERSDLVGKYIGHTEANTKRIIEETLGGVLFIDEAYQLSNGSENDFGKQAIETLLTAMENYRENMIFIFAGYSNEMENFLDTNPGLRSRIQKVIEFEDYTPKEVAKITDSILSKNWFYNKEILFDTVENIYNNLPENQKANGRTARNLAEEIIREQKISIVDNNLLGEDMKKISNIVFEKILRKYF